MPDQAKARDVGAAVKLKSLCQTNRRLVEGAHRVKHGCGLVLPDELTLNGRGDDARADRLGQQQDIARVRTAVGEHAVERNKTAHRQTVLGLVVVDGVAARDGATRLDALVGAARQNLTGNLNAQTARDTQQVHGMARPPAHGVDVRQRVGRGDLAKQERVVDHRRKEVDGLHEPQVLPYAEDARIVGGIKPHEQVVVMHIGQIAQDLGEGSGSQLSGSTARGSHRRELNLIVSHRFLLSSVNHFLPVYA